MKNILVAAALLLAAASTANAQTVNAGKYTVEGINLDGSSYSGTAEITLASETTCVIEWDTAGVKSTGVCMLNGDAFAAAYVLEDEMGLTVYKVKGDGTLEGNWTITGKDGSGTEVLTEVK
jgi:opacity protein-like surface antigen